MSDPVTSVDIEDVLSSIRKLVSEGEQSRLRDTSLATKPAPMPQKAESKPAKLVLTPEHMIAAAPEETASEEAEAPLRLTQIVWDDSANESHAPEPTAESEEASEQVEPEAGEEEAHHLSRSELEATIAELEASVGGEFEPDGSEEAEVVATVPWPGTRRREAPLQEAFEEETFDDESADYAASEDEDRTDAMLASDDEIEEFLADPGMLDEEMLRQLVAEIVREELQGALGERITRNVRKLVRREIYRILNSQEFD